MKLDDAGEKFLKGDEGCKVKPYLDSKKVWTIGWGHTEGVAANTPEITPQKAEELFQDDLYPVERAVSYCVDIFITQNEFNALCSFTFNEGVPAFKTSKLLKLLNFGDRQGAAKEFDRWIYIKDKKTGEVTEVPGLANRRAKEKALFLKDFLAKRIGQDRDAV